MLDCERLKREYNCNLSRYYNGCNYISEHPQEMDKYWEEIMDIKENIDILLNEIMKEQTVTEDEILEGFKIC